MPPTRQREGESRWVVCRCCCAESRNSLKQRPEGWSLMAPAWGVISKCKNVYRPLKEDHWSPHLAIYSAAEQGTSAAFRRCQLWRCSLALLAVTDKMCVWMYANVIFVVHYFLKDRNGTISFPFFMRPLCWLGGWRSSNCTPPHPPGPLDTSLAFRYHERRTRLTELLRCQMWKETRNIAGT